MSSILKFETTSAEQEQSVRTITDFSDLLHQQVNDLQSQIQQNKKMIKATMAELHFTARNFYTLLLHYWVRASNGSAVYCDICIMATLVRVAKLWT